MTLPDPNIPIPDPPLHGELAKAEKFDNHIKDILGVNTSRPCPWCGFRIEDFDTADWCPECDGLLNGDENGL